MDRTTAVNIIKRVTGQKYKTQLAAAEAIGISYVAFNRALNQTCRPIPKEMLEMAGLEEAKAPPTTYRRKV